MLVGDFLQVLQLALGQNSQLLLWLFSSTDIVDMWVVGLRNLVDTPHAQLADDAQLTWVLVAHTHLQALQMLANALQRDGVGASALADLTCWGAAVSFLRDVPVWQFLVEALHSKLPPSVNRRALGVVGDLCSVSLAGVDLSASDAE
eukprot:4232510-Amphidinium_carterae.1